MAAGSFPPIAIVGRSCVVPGALSPAQLWRAVAGGVDLLTRVPAGRWRMSPEQALCGAGEDTRDRSVTDCGGYVRGFEQVFDPSGLAVPAAELATLDPLFHWVLHTARAARDDWRSDGETHRAAAILGNLSFPSEGLSRLAEATWLEAQEERIAEARLRAGLGEMDPRNRFMSGLPALLLARALGLGGGAFALDAACASSLYAIKLGCDWLHDGRVDMVLAGAVNRADDLFIHMGFTALSALSPSGRSRPFHRRADGLVPAEGAGFVALRRLDDAVAEGDRIHGVIRGIGLCNDGSAGGLLAPSEDGQVAAVEQAYKAAGLEPYQVSMLECHATGTEVGDSVEVRSTGRVFAGVQDLPIGSLKSNLGHLITVAGVAGLIKVLEAMRAGLRPPSLHADDPMEELQASPFRVLGASELWEVHSPRRAGLSAFGFGGNNAHLIVEEYNEQALGVSRSVAVAVPAVAVVGVGARIGDHQGRAAFESALFSPAPPQLTRCEELTVRLSGLRVPPNDLEVTLAQQLMVLEAAREAVAGVAELPAASSGVLVGMGADPEVARYGARWRMIDWGLRWQADEQWVSAARERVISSLGPAGVLGTMPNVPANRLNVQLDLRGPSFTVAAEEASGLVALDLAATALRNRELDAAVVAAVDLSCEPVHRGAAAAVLPVDRRPAGDAAVALVLKRLDDAQKHGDTIYAVLTESIDSRAPRWGLGIGAASLVARFGHAHAASGLVHALAAVLALARKRLPGGEPWPEHLPQRLTVEVVAMEGGRVRVGLERGPSTLAAGDEKVTSAIPVRGPLLRLACHPSEILLPRILTEAAPARPRVDEEPVQNTTPDPGVVQRMDPAPALPLASDDTTVAPAGLRTGRRSRTPGPAAEPLVAVARESLARVAAVHQEYLEEQARAHAAYLAVQERAMAVLAEAAGSTAAESPPDTSASAFVDLPEQAPAEEQAGADLIFSREQLRVHAEGRISEIFGELFEPQDGYRRQVRMPEPPLLLADRVVGLEAEPGSMGLGTIWTETDVTEDAWYLHQGRMPAGVMIEAGQADLMLISFLGIDLLNRGERVYRLLGCELTYHSDLPRPGETLSYDIHVDGHAKQGDVRLFFFHYDCRVNDQLRLSVREGQAGFFSDQELAESAGVLWSPEEAEITPEPRLDPPAVESSVDHLEPEQIRDLAEGRPWLCLGAAFEHAKTHSRTPRIQTGDMLFLERITHLDNRGGPWGRGYLRATTRIRPDDWFFEGHFKNDPCMPGTLMFEGCLQAMAVLLTSQGFTLHRDGWRFQPVPDQPYPLRCRGQVDPASEEIVYEIFVDEVISGPEPTLYAHMLCTVDGLKAFHGERVGLRLVPDWPLSSRPELLADHVEPGPVAEVEGFSFGYASLLASALGRPSDAFGPMYETFDGTRRVARLPGPPYHFMSRVTRIEGEIGSCTTGAEIELEFDVPPDAWFFEANGARTMPFCVLLEAVLQPCGWLASYVGSALTVDEDLSFRNLDGSGTLTAEVLPSSGTLRTRVRITEVSRTGGMIIEAFHVACFLGEQQIYELRTVFGFFPQVALENQVGLPTTDDQRAVLAAASDFSVDLRQRPERYCAGSLRLADEMLLMIDGVTGFWPDTGLGRLRAEKLVDPGEWFFKAHFFTDPVQPGSLGLEAMVQLLQFYMLETGMGEGVEHPRFEPLAVDRELTWKYRGQVLPSNQLISVTMDITDKGRDERGPWAVATASLWVDGKRIYEASGLGMRIVGGGVG